ncbi:MAG: hypothetical protein U0841_23495 [Chloroflexia bacterium]
MGAGVNAATPGGTPRLPAGFARARLRIIHAALAFVAGDPVDNAEIATPATPEASAYADVLFGSRRVAGVSPTGELAASSMCATTCPTPSSSPPNAGNLRTIIATDAQPAPAPGTRQIRFLPLDPAAGTALDLAAVGGPVLATGIAPFTTGLRRAPRRLPPAWKCAHPASKPPSTPSRSRSTPHDRYTAVLSGSAATQTLRLLPLPRRRKRSAKRAPALAAGALWLALVGALR